MILTVIFFCACNNSPFDHATKTVKVKGTIKLELSNAEYPIDVTINGKVKLINGDYEEQAAPGSATKIKVSLSKHQSLGDLNGNCKEDDAIFLLADPGGRGTFYYLSAVIFENGKPKPVDSTFIGDRVIINSTDIESGQVIVNLLTRAPDEHMTEEPSIETVYTFILQNGKLLAIQ